jgi:hypothetical protein
LDEGAPSAAAGKIENVSAGLCGFGLLQPGMLAHELGNALSVTPVTVNSGRCRNSFGSRDGLRRRRTRTRRNGYSFWLLVLFFLLLLLLLLTLGSDN